jgi:uncharacterized membrane protein
MKWLVALLACIGIAQAQVIQHQIADDGYARVPLQFGFTMVVSLLNLICSAMVLLVFSILQILGVAQDSI